MIVSDGSLSDTVIVSLTVQSALILSITFDEGSGDTAYDSSSSNYDGVISGASYVAGLTNTALSFDGNDSVSFGDVLDFGTSDFSALAWVKTTNTWGYHILFSKKSGSSDHFVLRTRNQGILECNIYDGSNKVNLIGSISVTDGLWHLICITGDRDGALRLYIDNVEDTAYSDMSALNDINNSGSFMIGGEGGSIAEGFIGTVEGAKVYNRILDSSEVVAAFDDSAQTAKRRGDQPDIEKFVFNNNLIDITVSPNPFLNNTTFNFTILETKDMEISFVNLSVYDQYGIMIIELYSGWNKPGKFSIFWDGKPNEAETLKPGLYYYLLTVDDIQQSGKLLFIK